MTNPRKRQSGSPRSSDLRRQTEEALRESEQRFRALVEMTSDWVWAVDQEGYYTYASPKVKDLLGYEPEEVIGRTPFDLMPPEEAERVRALFEDHVKARKPIRGLENVKLHKDGRRVVLETSGVPILDEEGDFFGYRGIDRDVTERKQAEEEKLRESEQRLAGILSSLTDHISIVDENHSIVWANDVAKRLFGPDLVGRKCYKEYHGFEKACESCLVTETFADRKVHEHETEVVGSGGNRMVFWCVSSVTAWNEDRTPKLVVEVSRDITERKRAQEALRQSEEIYRSLVENIDAGITLVDSSYTIVTVNPGIARMFGKRVDEFPGKKCFREFEKRDAVCDHCPGTKAMATGQTAEVETQGVRDDGSRFWARLGAFPLFGPEGIVTGFIELAEDITGRKRAEEELRRSHEEVQAIYSGMSDGLLVADVETKRFVRVNPSMCRMLGYSESELLSLSVKDIHPAHEVPSVLEQFMAQARGELPVAEMLPVLRKDGTVFYADICSSPIIYRGRHCTIGFFRDVTERRQHDSEMARAKDLAEAANVAKSQFLANMSHEIRTPMTAILGFADLLTTPNLPHREQRQFVDAIQRNGKALLELINDILDLSRIEADKLTLEKADCPLRQLIDDILSVVRVRAREKRLSLDVDYEFPLPERIRTDPVRLRQILVNLLGNAIKFTDRGGVRIAVRCTREGDEAARVQFAVSDTGIGIPADKIGQLFQPFVQADTSLTRRYGGSGLGLAISRRLAHALGGDIEATSELGKGSTFTLSIPAGSLAGVPMLQAVQAAAAEREEPLPKEQQLTLHGRVLLAEDVPDIHEAVARVLRKMGLDVEIAEDGRLACEMAEKSMAEARPYDLILMDIQMPELNGYEATRRLRRRGWQGPIVALTAHAMLGDREKCLEAGCDDYIAKPITGQALLDVLARHLGHAVTLPDRVSTGGQAAAGPAGLFGSGPLDAADVAQLVEAFAGELPDRARLIEDALRSRDCGLLAELAHQLKGTAGLYGFARIADAARAIHQRATEEQDLEQLRAAVEELARLCGQATQDVGTGASPR